MIMQSHCHKAVRLYEEDTIKDRSTQGHLSVSWAEHVSFVFALESNARH